ncbi:HD domain-containing protein [Crassaminicella thermophila]|uniref:HD domain-containing protein n=1 Tax=Crassaminicella thermophila TaxID=2599308 RepID=A0A5C0S914_CRATE|nr:HD domain-containing protein [Crassaminicella thermophila]QEK11033.1 HD domain-containing protein [Crassaminicella thermophila]
MERVNKILHNPKYIDYLNRNAQAEKNRIFCHHDLRHAIDVARVSYILALEENLSIKKEVIYAAALLHDIGRWKEYLQGIDHASASADLASEILKESGYIKEEKDLIYSAIRNHRKYNKQNPPLDKILYKSDKISRPCSECLVINQCKRFLNGGNPKIDY